MASPYANTRYLSQDYTRPDPDEELLGAAAPAPLTQPTLSIDQYSDKKRQDPAGFGAMFMERRAAAPAVPAAAPPQNATAPAAAQRRGHRREMLSTLGSAAGFQAAQAVTNLIPTTMDRANNQRLRELEEMRKSGNLGLSADESEHYNRALTGARALARSSAQRQEAQAAANGSRTSAAAQSRIQRDTQRGMLEQATKVGLAKADANYQAKQAQLMEEQQRLAAKDQRQKQGLSALSQGIGAAGALAGQVRAGRAIEQLDLSALDLSAGEAATLTSAIYQNPGQANALVKMFSGLAPRTDGG